MNISKATREDIDKTREFLQFMENLFESKPYGLYSFHDESRLCSSFPEDLDEYKLLQRIRDGFATEKGCEPSKVDNRLVLYEAIVTMYKRCDIHWNRVLMSADILIDSCCDPCETHLTWHPFIERAVDNGYYGE